MSVSAFRNRNGTFPRSRAVMGGEKCKFCQRKIKMGAIDEHRCYRTIISISIDRAQLKRIDDLATAAGVSRSEFMTAMSLAGGALTDDEMQLLALVRGMRGERR